MVYTSLATLLLVAAPTFNPSSISPDSCLSNSYHGIPGGQSIFFTNKDCLDTLTEGFMSGNERVFKIQIPDDSHSRLLWVHREAVDVEPLIMHEPPLVAWGELDVFFKRVAESESLAIAKSNDGQQQVLQGQLRTPRRATLLAQGPTYSLISIDPSLETVYDSFLPHNWRGTLLTSAQEAPVPVPSAAVDRVKGLLKKVKFDPVVASLVNNISVPQMKNDIRFLTGEDDKSGIVSRHSFSSGILVAADWIKDRIEETGASCELKNFLPGFGPNVICKYPATVNTTETVLFSAHYDSRGSFGSTRAPGGDDDGSGTIAILGIARTIARRGVSFQKNVELCLFAGEEQGLFGSRAYARELRELGADLTLMVQADMLAYHAAGEPPQLGLPDLIGTAEVAQLVANLSSIYSPELSVGFTSGCCSDHQSFHEQGFPATQVFERAGPIADPMYHNSGDLSDREGYDFDQVKSIAKVQFATLLHATGFDLPEDKE